ncbi:MAG: Uncharacterized protein FD161_4825 [Limisphaerales bacterium]|nr:MAG: Uncharacterized protein FD161_4825 [Limisphaerales bacterium]TXT49458.1 MAG: Uncharacterized protein FD140_2990 [Limisphaerales bacterium]
MTEAQIARQVAALPQDAQRLVLDMIAALKPETTPSKPARAARKPKRTPLHKERFVGMWRDRAEMSDSAAWVRSMRERDWSRG